jgi:hypothetical protein
MTLSFVDERLSANGHTSIPAIHRKGRSLIHSRRSGVAARMSFGRDFHAQGEEEKKLSSRFPRRRCRTVDSLADNEAELLIPDIHSYPSLLPP